MGGGVIEKDLPYILWNTVYSGYCYLCGTLWSFKNRRAFNE